MKRFLNTPSQLLAAATQACALVAACALPLTSQASPTVYVVPYAGSGFLVDNGPVNGQPTGAWLGTIDETPPTITGDLPSLLSTVSFTLDPSTFTLTGLFEFDVAADLQSTIYGQFSGQYFDTDLLSTGGLIALDYTVLGGTGTFFDASGYGIAFLNVDAASGGFSNYAEAGLLNVTVPEPGSLALVGLGLLAAVAGRRRSAAPAALAA